MPATDWVLGGPVFWFVTTLLFLAGMLAAFVTVDCVRRTIGVLREPMRWHYVVPQVLYLSLLFFGEAGAMPLIVSAFVVLATPIALAQGVTYLLRVVFPKPQDEDGDAAALEAAEEPTEDAGARI